MPMAAGGYGDKSLEFIEFKNTASVWVDIGGCRIDSASKIRIPVTYAGTPTWLCR